MQWYQSKGIFNVMASKPEDAAPDFIQEAKKRGLYLYEAKTYDPNIGMFGEPIMFFGNAQAEQLVGHSDYLVLFGDKEWITINEKIFNEGFSLVGSSDPLPTTPIAPIARKLKGKSFYLDPGHGGSDPGAVNDNFGFREKIAALEIALKLGLILEAQGAAIFYSRIDNDIRPGLTQRANDANSLNVTAFISIHLNSAENKAASGIETLVYSLNGTAAQLAEKVQGNMVAATGFKNRGVKARPDLTVLAKTKMPAILCEVGFISNDSEALQLFNIHTQDKIADAIASGIVAQFGT